MKEMKLDVSELTEKGSARNDKKRVRQSLTKSSQKFQEARVKIRQRSLFLRKKERKLKVSPMKTEPSMRNF